MPFANEETFDILLIFVGCRRNWRQTAHVMNTDIDFQSHNVLQRLAKRARINVRSNLF